MKDSDSVASTTVSELGKMFDSDSDTSRLDKYRNNKARQYSKRARADKLEDKEEGLNAQTCPSMSSSHHNHPDNEQHRRDMIDGALQDKIKDLDEKVGVVREVIENRIADRNFNDLVEQDAHAGGPDANVLTDRAREEYIKSHPEFQDSAKRPLSDSEADDKSNGDFKPQKRTKLDGDLDDQSYEQYKSQIRPKSDFQDTKGLELESTEPTSIFDMDGGD